MSVEPNQPWSGKSESLSRGASGRKRRSKRARNPLAFKLVDFFLETGIFLMVVCCPWAFGSTDNWAVWAMTVIGLGLGVGWIAKQSVARSLGVVIQYWNQGQTSFRDRWSVRGLKVMTVLLLAYCALSAWNARATFYPYQDRFEYHENYIEWLPHSYDSRISWMMFWMYAGLACFFWVTRDWLLCRTSREMPSVQSIQDPENLVRGMEKPVQTVFPPERMRRLLWVLCISGALLALVSIFQRLEGTNKLLWIKEPKWNQQRMAQFGAYAYRSNAAQYFNLLWPVCLGFWWVMDHRVRQMFAQVGRMGSRPEMMLLVFALVLISAPIISTSRGGAMVDLGMVLAAVGIFSFSIWKKKQQRGTFLAFALVLAAALSLGAYVGWKPMMKRIEQVRDSSLSGRTYIYQTGQLMEEDFAWLGSGPGTFGVIYQFYKDPGQDWAAYAHDDWMESRITFGKLGFGMILFSLALILWGGLPLPWKAHAEMREFTFLIYLALAGCLVHSLYDFPFQIYSILHLFILNACILLCLGAWRKQGNRADSLHREVSY